MNDSWNDFTVTGHIPEIIIEADPRPAAEQVQEHYAHGGGWMPFTGFTLHQWPNEPDRPAELHYPDDPPTLEKARRVLHEGTDKEELLILFAHDWLCVVALDGSFQISRMD